MATLQFCGAAGTVTGSCSLVRTSQTKFLVDCGLFQGNRTTEELNQGEFPFDPRSLQFVLLTHAHIDHTGLLPKLIKGGYGGPIFATQATCDLLQFMLPDSAYIQENNAERRTKKNRRRGLPEVHPVYTIDDAKEVLKRLQPLEYGRWYQVNSDNELVSVNASDDAAGVNLRYWNAGHLLGSASIEMSLHDQASDGGSTDAQASDDDSTLRLLFSGDLGPQEKAFHPPPSGSAGYDYVICESTYGGRDRVDYTLDARREAIRRELIDGLSRGGNVVIPSFAVERSQELLHDIAVVLNEGHLPDATVYVDSPMARKATEVFIKHANEMEDIEVPTQELFRHAQFRLIQSVDESKQLNEVRRGAIIISASGMCTAGRIKHHLKNNIYRPESTILFVGYQSPGTLGHIITSGAEAVRIHGKEYQVRADIRRIGNYSAHADGPELMQWVQDRMPIHGALFLNHGEDDSRHKMRSELKHQGLDESRIFLPRFDQTFELDHHHVVAGAEPTPRLDPDQIKEDWNQLHAQFLLDLADSLRECQQAGDRSKLLRRLSKQLPHAG